MVTEVDANTTEELLTNLGDRLHSDVCFCKQFIAESDRPRIEKEWMLSFQNTCNYALLLIKSFIQSLGDYQTLPDEQFHYYVGKIAIQHLLETINVFEHTLNKLVETNPVFSGLIQSRIDKKIEIIEMNWNSESKGKNKKLKINIINQYKNKIHEMAFIRDTLRSAKKIDDTDYQILSFVWEIRNSMHRNFTSTKDIDFKYPDIKTGNVYRFKFSKGQELYHPQDLISYYTMTEQLSFIMLKILQNFGE